MLSNVNDVLVCHQMINLKASHKWNFLFCAETWTDFAGLAMVWSILLQNTSNFLIYLLERLPANNYFMHNSKEL